MKPLIIAALLLAGILPVNATPWRDIHNYRDSRAACMYDNPDDGERTSKEVVKACAEADRLQKKLKARGYCAYGKTAIGRTGKPWTQKEWTQAGLFETTWSKGARHCYTIHDPSIPSYFHQQ